MIAAFMKWSFDPVFVQFGRLTIRWYGILFMLAFVMAIVIMNWIYRVERKPRDDVGVLMLCLMVGTIVGARLGHCFFYNPARYLREPLSILQTWKGGLSSHGGTIGIGIAIFLYARLHRDQPFLWLTDRVAVPVALGACFVRIGNFLNSEIRGIPTDVPWAVRFLVNGPRDRYQELRFESFARHPVQLYESLAYACIFVILFLVYRKLRERTPEALLIGLFLVCAFTARFFLEFFKVRQARYVNELPLSVGQLLSIPAVLLGVAALHRAWRKGPVRGSSKAA
jgi:prolipoprotein diacylglyceryl transferase